MIFTVDWVGIILFVLLGYLDDLILPQYYHYENTIVGIYKKYQCKLKLRRIFMNEEKY